MNKQELVKVVASKIELTQKDTGVIVDALLETIQETLAKGEEINLHGFAKLSVTERAARKGVNPQTKEEIEIKASKAVKFKALKGLKDSIQ